MNVIENPVQPDIAGTASHLDATYGGIFKRSFAAFVLLPDIVQAIEEGIDEGIHILPI